MSDDLSSSEAQTAARPTTLRFVGTYVLPTLVLLVIALWPIINGSRTLFFRDVVNTHLEMKWFQAQAMRDGYLPLVDHYRAGGQPHLGNPNTVALYPDNVLYLVADPFWAMNAHFWMHLLLAPFTLYWLARAWGLRREAAWAGGVVFAVSGYVLSCLNLYNLIAAAVWAPALAAVAIKLASPDRRARWLWATAVVWALLILAGDPITAVLALALAGTAVLAKHGLRESRWAALAAAIGLGTLLAAPLVLEFVRILSLSYRGHWGYSVRAATAGSWHPIRIVDWFLPLAFGRPDLLFWGHRFHAGFPPLLYSLSPGLIAMSLLMVGVGVRARATYWAGWSIAIGLFFALGQTNPVVAGLLSLPGGGLLRMPVKFWLLATVGGAVLVALGVERLLEKSPRGVLTRVLALLAGALGLLWSSLLLAPASIEALIGGWMPASLSAELASQERLRWTGLALLSLLLLVAVLAVVRIGRKKYPRVIPVLLVIHVASQLFFLRPLLESDEVAAYRAASPAEAVIPVGARVVHGTVGDLFEKGRPQVYPDASARWLHRQTFREFFPPAGIMAGRRYEFNLSPEGLDSFLTRATVQAAERLGDAERLRILAASGVEWLILKRELDPTAMDSGDVELVDQFDSGDAPVHIYRLSGTAEEAQFVGTTHSSASLNEALAKLLAPNFDPRSHAVLAGEVSPGSGATGRVRTLVSEGERMLWEVESAGAGALLVQRSHLPLYKATVDGEPAPVYVANLHRMAILLEPGRHTVELRVDRSRFRLGLALSLAAIVLLAVASRGMVARRLGIADNSGGL